MPYSLPRILSRRIGGTPQAARRAFGVVHALAPLALVFAMGATQAAAAERLVVVTNGGNYETMMKKHFLAPFTAATGIEVVAVSATGADAIARVKAMVEGGNVEWDLYVSGEIQAASDLHKSLNEDMTEFCRPYAGDADLLPNVCGHAGVLAGYGTTLIAYNTAAFAEKTPRNWADFWDTKTFPGSRAMPNFSDPWRVLAAALLADGVAPDRLFPLDVDRALSKLDELKPNIGLWWKTGDQSTQGFRTREYVMGQIWQTRATALKKEGQPLAWSQEQAFLVGDRWALVKGAPNRQNAIKFLQFFLESKEGQAGWCEESTCTPVRYSAIALMSPEVRASIPTSPEVMAKLITPDAEWINANNVALLERWNAWISE